MKRSEYRAKRLAAYSTDPKAVPDAWLDHDCDAAEAAGVVWDPEEPQEMQLRAFESYESGFHGWRIGLSRVAVINPFTEAQAREVIRRYEAFPKLWRLADAPNEFVPVISARSFQDFLLAILNGKEGS